MAEINKSYYAIIPANVRYDKRLSANAKLLYGEITALCNEKGYCWARNKYFADLYEVSDRSIRSWISKLIEYGYIKSEIKYADGSKEVETRLLYLPEPTTPISGGPEKNFRRGTEEIFRGGAEENFRDNNTNNNNTNINISKKEIYKERNGEKWESENRTDNVDNTNQSGGCHFQKGEGSLLKGGGVTFKSETYTENTTNNTTNIFLKKENLIKEKNQNEISNLPCTENSDTEKTVHDSSDNNTGNICKKSINNGNSNNKEIVTNQKVDNNKGTLLITGENPKARKKNSAKRKKEGETFSSIIHSYTNNEEMQELLTEFIEIRTKMNRLLTPSSLRRNLKVLDRIALEDGGDGTDEEKIKIIERTVINSWQGFYSLKSSAYSSPVMKKVHQGGGQSNKKSGKLFDEPSYDISEYENWNPIEEHKHVNTLDEMLELKKAEKRQKYVDLEIKEND